MPRCYMVKKQSNKYQNPMRDTWESNNTAPESPTEGCVAPPYYNSPINNSDYSGDFVPNGSLKEEESKERCEDKTSHILQKLRTIEETEAAHDLLSLSQSLPPLQGPTTVTIPTDIPTNTRTENASPRTPSNACIRTTPYEGNVIANQHEHSFIRYQESRISYTIPTTTQVVMPIPCYPTPIVYVLQMPPIPTPPTSDCSSDTENIQTPTFSTFDKIKFGNISTSENHNSDILILPLSPEPETTEVNSKNGKGSESVEVKQQVERETVIVSCPAEIPDRRQRKNRRTNNKRLGIRGASVDESLTNQRTPTDSTTKDSRIVADEEVVPDCESDTQTEVSGDTKSRYVCQECGKQYATSSNLSRHKQTHRSLDSHSAKKCITCGKAYVSMPALAMHLLTHKLSHCCGVCGKQFSRPWLLQGHLRSHTGEKPYACAHCGKAFADRSNLRAHMMTHSHEKNFSCFKCKKTFVLKSYLNKHQESTCLSAAERKKFGIETRPSTQDNQTQTVLKYVGH